MRRFHNRLKQLEAVAGKCPGDASYQRGRLYHATRSGAKNIPPNPPCKLCGEFHRHADGSPVVRRVIVTVPDDSELAARLGPLGFREETDSWHGGGRQQ